jgi:acyl carrier protein
VVDLRKRIEETAPESRVSVLEEFLRTEAAQVLGMADASRIDPEFPLNELGLDSLLALELRNRLGAAMGAKQPATLLFNYPTVAALVAHFAPILVPLASDPSPNPGGDDALGAEIAAMSEAQLAALIDGEFEALQKQ